MHPPYSIYSIYISLLIIIENIWDDTGANTNNKYDNPNNILISIARDNLSERSNDIKNTSVVRHKIHGNDAEGGDSGNNIQGGGSSATPPFSSSSSSSNNDYVVPKHVLEAVSGESSSSSPSTGTSSSSNNSSEDSKKRKHGEVTSSSNNSNNSHTVLIQNLTHVAHMKGIPPPRPPPRK